MRLLSYLFSLLLAYTFLVPLQVRADFPVPDGAPVSFDLHLQGPAGFNGYFDAPTLPVAWNAQTGSYSIDWQGYGNDALIIDDPDNSIAFGSNGLSWDIPVSNTENQNTAEYMGALEFNLETRQPVIGAAANTASVYVYNSEGNTIGSLENYNSESTVSNFIQPVPEPATVAILGLPLIGLLYRRARPSFAPVAS